jgi:hypothetical protein
MAGGDASKVKVGVSVTKIDKASSLDKDGWLTQAQIARHYNLDKDSAELNLGRSKCGLSVMRHVLAHQLHQRPCR